MRYTLLNFLYIFLLHTILKNNFEPTKDDLLWIFSFEFGTLIRHFVAYLRLNFGDAKAELFTIIIIIII